MYSGVGRPIWTVYDTVFRHHVTRYMVSNFNYRFLPHSLDVAAGVNRLLYALGSSLFSVTENEMGRFQS